jgi:hypothetical protein
MSAKPRPSAVGNLLAIVALVGAAAVLAGCGGSSAPKVTAGQNAQQTPLQSNADVGGAKGQASGSRGARAGSYHVEVGRAAQKGRETPSTSKDDLNKASGSAFNPCQLVTLPEAQAITSGGVTARTEAPLGPTCIYKSAKSEITVAIESLKLSQVSRKLGNPQSLNVGSHRAYCGRLGTQMLYLPLASGKLLHVTAPCAIAQQFAARALTRIAA